MPIKALKTATVALNHEKIGKNSQKISKTKPFINNYNRKWINYPSGKDDWKKFEKNNQGIALKVLYVKKDYISCLHFKMQLKSWKTNYSFDTSKWRRMTLYCSKRMICIIKGMLQPIFCIDINTHSDRRLKNYVNVFLKNYFFSKYFSFYWSF